MENLPTYRLTQSGPEAQEILDQVNLNTTDIEQLKRLYQALSQSDPEIIEPNDTWPVANPEENVIYRVIDRVNTPPQYYSDYMWNGTSMVLMGQYNNAIDNEPTANSNNLVKSGGVYSFVHANGGAYDISAAHAVGGVLATYDDLEDALGTNGANVPAAVRKGGMSIKFVNSSDNKYVRYNYLLNSTSNANFSNVDNWVGVDEEPVAGSKNLVESGGASIYNSFIGLFDDSNVIDKLASQRTLVADKAILCPEYISVENGDSFTFLFNITASDEPSLQDVYFRVWEYDSNDNILNRNDFPYNQGTVRLSISDSNTVKVKYGLYIRSTYSGSGGTVYIDALMIEGSVRFNPALVNNDENESVQNLLDKRLTTTEEAEFERIDIEELLFVQDKGGIIPETGAYKATGDGYVMYALKNLDNFNAKYVVANVGNYSGYSIHFYSANLDLVDRTNFTSSWIGSASVPANPTNNYRVLVPSNCKTVVFCNKTATVAEPSFFIDRPIVNVCAKVVDNMLVHKSNEVNEWHLKTGYYINPDGTLHSSGSYMHLHYINGEEIKGIIEIEADAYLSSDVSPVIAFYSGIVDFDNGTNLNTFMSQSTLFAKSVDNYRAYIPEGCKTIAVVDNTNVHATSTKIIVTREKPEQYKTINGNNIKGVGDIKTEQYVVEKDAYAVRKSIPDYYFAMSSNPTTTDYDEYVDKQIAKVPVTNKRVIFFTDSHWMGYHWTGEQGRNYEGISTPIMQYCKSKLGIKHVLFGGDVLIQNMTQGQALQLGKRFMNNVLSAFGNDMLFCRGDHDLNQVDSNNYTDADLLTWELTYPIWNRYLEGSVIFDDKLVDRAVALGHTQSVSIDEIRAFSKGHYYKDDGISKTRYIVIDTGASWDNSPLNWYAGGTDGVIQMQFSFLYDALITVPDSWDIIVVMHNGINWNTKIVGGNELQVAMILSAFKTKTRIVMTDLIGNSRRRNINYNGTDYDFSTVEQNIGKIFVLSGDTHHDCAAVCQTMTIEGEEQYISIPYTDELTLSDDAILYICTQCEVCGGNSVNGGTDYPMTQGTITETAFDIVSWDDEHVYCTRVGTGIDRVFDYE